MMIPYKGTKASNLRQYLPKKPKKRGFKLFVRSGMSGFVYDFFMYMGGSTFENIDFSPEEEELGLGGKVVTLLCREISAPSNSIVYFDNFFCSLELIHLLKQKYGIRSLGTIRNNRLRGCILKSDKELIRQGRGSYDYQVDNCAELAVVKWNDNKPVTLVSSCVSKDPVTEVKRYSKQEKIKIPVPCPEIVKQYNIHMGGVDLTDMLVALYRTPLKSRRWYLGIFAQILDICVINAWLLYRRDVDSTGRKRYDKLKTFRLDVSRALINYQNNKRGRPSHFDVSPNQIKNPVIARPVSDSRYDNIGHFPNESEKGRCRFCVKGQTSIICVKCNVRLCLVIGKNSRNCFYAFHVK